MKTYTKEELKAILEKHYKWLIGNGGGRADLSNADLSYANLRSANLSGVSLISADLSNADLRSASLRYADLRYANLSGVSLISADLSNADLSYANLRSANLRSASLRSADLRYANLSGVSLPSPTMLLLCQWGDVSDKLTTELMRYDASNHPNPEKFDEWAAGGDCPYQSGFQRCANFTEKRGLWKKGKSKSARELALMLFKEKKIKYSDGI